jgi:hypothetical protein
MNAVFADIDVKKLMDVLGPGFLIFIFFVLPILRAVKEARDKQKEVIAKRGTSSEADARGDTDTARKMWEDLMRGDAPTPVAPPTILSVPAQPPPLPAAEARDAAQSLAGSISVLSEAQPEAEMERTFDEERTAQDENEALRRGEYERRELFLRREREGAATPRANVEPGTITSFDFGGDETGQARADAARRRDLLGLSGSRRAALQRAVVASEVLGRPVALRTGGEELGPLALRQ